MIGRIIGNYQITSELAQGGMGAVYRARHLHLPREVVVKSILLAAFTPSAQVHLKARFRREAYVQSQLDHPNIVRVYEFFAAEDNYYLVMEYVAGMSLRDLLARQGTPTPAQAVYLLKQALASLDYAHNFGYQDESEHAHTGVIHRDIKPANILLDTKGKLKITDFGIVKVIGEQTGLAMTQSGFHPGTVEYMSPEQLLGLEIDARSDLYSLGVTFYEMLTGRLPFQRSATGSDWEIRKGHIELSPPPIQELRPEVHPQLAAIIARSLLKNPNERYQSAAEFLEAVRNYEQRHAEKEQALHSPAVKHTQPQTTKSTQQAMKSTLIDETATLLARPASNGSPDGLLDGPLDERKDESSQPRKAHLEDEITRLMKPGAVSPDPAGPKSVTPQAVQSGRRWPLAAGGLGILLVGTAAGAILFSQQRSPERAPQTETAKVEMQSPSPSLEPSPTARAASKPRPSPPPGEKTGFKQAQKFEQQEQYDQAINIYEDYLARNPNAPDANVIASYLEGLRKVQTILGAADSAMNSRMYPAAKRAYIKALELRPNSQRAKLGLADADIKMRSMTPPGGDRRFPFEFPPPNTRQGRRRPQERQEQQDRPEQPNRPPLTFDQPLPPNPKPTRKTAKPTPTPREKKPQ
ncbi:MAG: protein kinase [Blastocatellales bacterium]